MTCTQPVIVSATSHGGFISSLTSMNNACGQNQETKWLLKAEAGQTIELTLVDFNWSSDPMKHRSCFRTYGYITEPDNEDKIAICGARQRIRRLHATEGELGHTLQIVIYPTHGSLEFQNFLIHYRGNLI